MGVILKLSSLLRQATDWQETFEVNQYTPLDCLHDLEGRFPDIRKWTHDKHGKMWDLLQFFLNGEMLNRDELTSPIEDGDELFILLNIGGG